MNDAKEVFLGALDCASAEDLASYLDQACAGDAALRTRVEELLRARREAGSFLGGAWSSPTEDLPPLSESLGTLIGPYILLEQIGEGGMGVVYMADQQTPVRRRVALKVIKTGMDTRQVIARFEAERQALAMMDHSNIARVLDAGATDTGRPYFVMELVRGIPITAYCDQNNLPVHERLELFIQVCHAVQHAHQKGIIHRDLKPSNVLVTLNDGRAVPKVIDFGVAKATGQQLTEKTLFTAFAQMVGTPLYMSPEQAEMTSLDIDTRSDIYSLGVLLYELLTGTTPFDQERLRAAAFDEFRRIIREEEPPKPSTRISTLGEARMATAAHRQVDARRLSQLVEGDLDWIAMKCLEKDRQRRYHTADALAADLRRHIDDELVQARPPTLAYRVRKFARKYKVALTTVGIVALALVAGTAISTWQALRANQARREAEASLAREAELRHEAEARQSILRAQSLCDAGEFERAEMLMREMPPESIRLEAKSSALIFGAVANWNGGEQRWKQAAAHYESLLFGQIDLGSDPNPDVISMHYLSYAPVLLELEDERGYEKLRESAIARFGFSRLFAPAERMLLACNLRPPSQQQINNMSVWAERVTAYFKLENRGYRGWGHAALALFEYRCTNYAEALANGQKCFSGNPPPPCLARGQIVMAMAHSRLNQLDKARDDLAACRGTIDSKFADKLGVGTYDSGLWKDWLIDRVLLREADQLLADQSPATKP